MPTFADQVTAVAALGPAIDGTAKPRRRRTRSRAGRGLNADRVVVDETSAAVPSTANTTA
jgi:hypothetical protein